MRISTFSKLFAKIQLSYCLMTNSSFEDLPWLKRADYHFNSIFAFSVRLLLKAFQHLKNGCQTPTQKVKIFCGRREASGLPISPDLTELPDTVIS